MAARRSGYPDKDIQGFKPAPCPTAAGAVEYKVRHRGRLLVPFFIAGQLLIEDALMARHRPYEIGPRAVCATWPLRWALLIGWRGWKRWKTVAAPDGGGVLPQAGHGDRAPLMDVERRSRVDPFDTDAYAR
jgi:hypothetical protein